MKKHSLLLIVVCTFFSQIALAQSDSLMSFSLEAAQAFALENNDTIKLAKLEEDKSLAQIKETRAIGLPQVNGKLGMQYFFDIPTQLLPDFVTPAVYGVLLAEGVQIQTDPTNIPMGGMTPAQFGTNYNISAEVSVNQLIFDGQYIVGLKASRAVKDLSASLRNTSEIGVKANVAKLYLQTLVLAENQELLIKNQKELDKNISEMKILFEEGLADELDVDRLVLTKQRIDNQVKNILNAHAMVKLLLKLQMGYPVEKPIELTDNLEMHTNSGSELATNKANPQARPEYQTLLLNRELQRLDMKRWQAGYIPQFVGYFSYSENALVNELDMANEGDNWFPTTVGGLQLNVPIFDGLTKSAKIQQSKVEVQKADIQLHQFEQAVIMQVEGAKNNYLLAQSEFETEKANLELAQKIYDRSKIMYEEGVGSSFELTSALTDLYTAQSAYLQSSYKLITTQINLEQALGQYN
ncbi:MAG: TolC family protein [Bacteroidia bacterium]